MTATAAPERADQDMGAPAGAGAEVGAGADLRDIDVWLFDIDDTLYPPDNGLMGEIRQRIADYLVRLTGKPEDEVRLLQRGWFETHGAALPGLLAAYDVTADEFLDDIHDLPLTQLSPNLALDAALQRLPGRRFAFTNGSAGHAERVLAKLGIARRFEGVFHIQSGDLTPKPHPATYDRMIAAFGIDPKATCFFEDSSRNLVHAHALGMTTVLVGGLDAAGPHIDYTTDDLVAFLNTARLKEPHP
jgi:putative hydrolase of the HAD superfamily